MIVTAILFVPMAFAQDRPITNVPADDETAITSAVKQFFAAYAGKDLSAWKSVWTIRSPYFEITQDEIKVIFGSAEKLEARVVTFEKPIVQDEIASVGVYVEFDGLPKTPGQQLISYRNGRWVLTLARENGQWKVFRRLSVEQDHAVQLIDAKSEDERNTLMTSSSRFVSAILIKTLTDEGDERLANIPFTEVERIYRIAAKLAEQSGDKGAIIGCIGWIAGKQGDRGNFVAAVEYAKKALELSRGFEDNARISERLSSLALIYLKNGRPREALTYFLEAVQLYETTGRPGANWVNYYRIGHCYLFMGDYVRAMGYYQTSMDVLKKANPNDELAVQKVTIANLYQLQGNYEQAMQYYSQSLATFEKTGSQYGVSISLAGLAQAFSSMGQSQKAIALEERALVTRKATANYIHTFESLKRLGGYYDSTGQIKIAADYFRQALDLAKSRESNGQMSAIYVELAKLEYEQQHFGESLQSALLAKSYAEKDPDLVKNWEIYFAIGRAYEAGGQILQAIQNYTKAIEVIENRRTQLVGGGVDNDLFFSQMNAVYAHLVGLLIRQNLESGAFSVSERRRSRALLESLLTGNPDTLESLTTAEKSNDTRLRDEMIGLNSQLGQENERKPKDKVRIDQLRDDLGKKRLEYEDFRTRLLASHPELKVQRGEMKPISLDEAGELLPNAKSAFIEFVVADDKAFAFDITKDAAGKQTLKAYPIDIKQKDLAARVEKYRSTLATGDLDFQKQSRDLYDLLLKPAHAQLAGKTNLIIVPDGPLWDLPFQALQNSQNRYLVEQAAVSYAPSLTALREMTKKSKKIGTNTHLELLAFGNPIVGKETAARVGRVFMSEKLDPLPEAERLVTTLGKMYGPTRSKIYIGADAREETAKSESPKYRILQFATHGILNNVSPMYSHLVLSQAANNPNEDGLLEAWEMKDLDLKADMVILSACETARGKISNGEGMIGMTWAMFIAGTPTTVASQWKVESTSTTELMLEFHRQLLTGKVTKAEALRRASLTLMKSVKYRHPSYWAGWVLVGDGN